MTVLDLRGRSFLSDVDVQEIIRHAQRGPVRLLMPEQGQPIEKLARLFTSTRIEADGQGAWTVWL